MSETILDPVAILIDDSRRCFQSQEFFCRGRRQLRSRSESHVKMLQRITRVHGTRATIVGGQNSNARKRGGYDCRLNPITPAARCQ